MENITEYSEAEKKEYLILDNFLPTPPHEDSGSFVEVPRNFITRNYRGYEVASVANIPIMDFDYKTYEAMLTPVAYEAHVYAEVDKLSENYRVYKTAGGYRVILTDKLVQVKDFDFLSWEHAGADPIYNLLCVRDNNYRARLTPKPERIGVSDLNSVINTRQWLKGLDSAPNDVREEYCDWYDEYSQKRKQYSTCMLTKFKQTSPCPSPIDEFIRYHDLATRAQISLPLA